MREKKRDIDSSREHRKKPTRNKVYTEISTRICPMNNTTKFGNNFAALFNKSITILAFWRRFSDEQQELLKNVQKRYAERLETVRLAT